jgi:Putative transmembrane protein (PGPGW)
VLIYKYFHTEILSNKVKKLIERLINRKPGRRFLYLHRLSNAYFKNKSGFYVLLAMIIASIFIMLGFIMLFLPGPGLLFIFLGMTPVLYLSKNFAKKLDSLEQFIHEFRGKNNKVK